MAELLYRLGRLSARRAWVVIVSWVAILGIAGGAFLAFGGALATSFSIPGTETERVSDSLSDTFPELTGANATVVFKSDDAKAFTQEQKTQIADVLKKVGDLDGVERAIDPFDAQKTLDDQRQQLVDGEQKLKDAETQLQTAEQQLTEGQTKLDAGKAQLNAAIAQAQAAGAYEAAKPQFDQQQAALAAEQAKIDQGKTQLESGRAEAKTSAETLKNGKAIASAAQDLKMVSDSGATAVGTIGFTNTVYTLDHNLTAKVRDVLDTANISGVSITYSATLTTSVDGLLGVGEIVGVVIAALVLLIMMRAILPAMTPLISSIIGVGVGVAGALSFSGAVDMTSVTPVLGVMLGLAVGIDYSLFILNRHRRQLLTGMDLHESIGLANGTAGNAVVFAGATVIVALAALVVTGIPFLGVMGFVAAGCVLVAVLVSITMTPALLGLMKMRVLSKGKRATIGKSVVEKPLKAIGIGRSIGAALLAIVVLLVIAIPALSMRLGLPDGSGEAVETPQYQTYKTVSSEFGAGQTGPLLVVTTFDSAVTDADKVATQASIVTELKAPADVSAVVPVAVSKDSKVFAFQVIPKGGPSSESTEKLVHTLRDMKLTENATIGVAGQASGNIDVSEKLQQALPVYLIVVIGLSLIIMILVFRSILVPLIATAGYVLSLFAALGAITAIYQWGWLGPVFDVHDPGPVLSFAPIIIMGVLFGLAMDYQLFLVSGMREAFVHGAEARKAVVAGLRNGRAVVTAAAIIMISVFGGFIFSHLHMIRPLGFGLAIGVLFDAFIVRMVLVPALMTVLGKSAWWLPKWLDKIMPDVDVEGAALERAHHTTQEQQEKSDVKPR